mgnify:CR=1 FL=1
MADDTIKVEPTPIKVGEKEYSQEDLSRLVGLGETAQEYETKWNRKVSEFYPDYTQKSQRLAELEKAEVDRLVTEETRKQKELEAKSQDQLTPEEARELAIKEAKGLGIVTRDDFDKEVNRAVANALGAKDLLDDINGMIKGADKKGQPKTSPGDLLKYMDENGIKNPDKAYKLMFEPEIDKWKEEQLTKIKPAGMETQTASTAGAKQPPEAAPLTRDNLAQVIRDTLNRGGGVGV